VLVVIRSYDAGTLLDMRFWARYWNFWGSEGFFMGFKSWYLVFKFWLRFTLKVGFKAGLLGQIFEKVAYITALV
jgi:hypothetical protein